MKIEWSAKFNNNFENMENGEIFSVDNHVFMKILPVYEYDNAVEDFSVLNCVNLENGICGYFNGKRVVTPLPNAVLKIS